MRAARLERELTQEVLAELSSLHWAYVGGIECGERNPTLAKVERIARALGVSPAELLR